MYYLFLNFFLFRFFPLSVCVTVHSCQQIVTSEVCHKYCEEGKSEVYLLVLFGAKPRQGGRVQRVHIYDERDERPCLLRVPTPVCSPCRFCPYSTEDDACGKQKFCPYQHSAVGAEKEEGEEAIGNHYACDMRGQPRTLEDWHQRCHLWV